MAEDENGQEKTEEPTAKKLEEARKKGQVPRSRELGAFAVMMLGSLGCIYSAGLVFDALRQVFRNSMEFERDVAFDQTWMPRLFEDAVVGAFSALAPLFIVLLLATLIAPGLMGGWIFSGESLKPKLSKMDPIKGFKKMFSANGLMELVKAFGKFLLVGATGILCLIWFKEPLFNLGYEDPHEAIVHGVTLLGWAFFILCCSLVFIIAIDVPFQLFQHNKQLKMTKQEVKDDYKDTEGKPEVKGRIRQLQREMSQRRMMEAVPSADVVITNPTHYAVALKYDPETMAVPVLVAKGVDNVAEQIRRIAKENKVTMITAPPLARSVYYHTKINQEIPHGLYVAVAQVLAYVFQLKNYRKGRGPNPGEVPPVEVPPNMRKD